MAENINGNGISSTTKWVIGLVVTLLLSGNAIAFLYTSSAHAEISRIRANTVEYRDLDLLRGDLENFKNEIRADIKANTKEVNEMKGMIKGLR